jgi:hypothetical protein
MTHSNDGKILFGVDYMCLAILMVNEGKMPELDFPASALAAAQFFLLQWGFSLDETNKVRELFNKKLDESNLVNSEVVRNRILEFLNDDIPSQKKLVKELVAIGNMYLGKTDDVNNLMLQWLKGFDITIITEISSLIEQGTEWAVGMNLFGKAYTHENPKRNLGEYLFS